MGVVITIVFGILLFKFLMFVRKENKMDEVELMDTSIDEKFSILIDGLNEQAYSGNGRITYIADKALNIYEEGSSQIITLQYSEGILTITWRRKYFQQEMTYTKHLEARNIDRSWQLSTLDVVVLEFAAKFRQHVAMIDSKML